MKVKHLLLGIALVALVAACGKKEAPVETPTETAVETPVVAVETPATEVATPVQTKKAEPKKAEAKKETTKPTVKKEEPKVDPCAQIVTDYESFSLRISSAYKNKGTGASAIKEYASLKKEAAAKEAAVKECAQNPTYKTRVAQAIVNVKKVL
ncbi:MAG: hypothetical protein WC679_05870 [Bacteroidales bacterium]|jgi:hypothetical protein